MTESTAENAAADPAAESATEPTAAEDKGKANREAARYRTQLREAQSQIESLTAQIKAMQTAEARRIAADPSADLYLVDARELPEGDYLNEDGLVDAEKIRAAIAALAEEKPYLVKKNPPVSTRPRLAPVPGHGSADAPTRNTVSWSDVLRSQ